MESMVYVADSDSAIDGLENPTAWENMPGRLILTDKEGGTEEIVPTWDSIYGLHPDTIYTMRYTRSMRISQKLNLNGMMRRIMKPDHFRLATIK